MRRILQEVDVTTSASVRIPGNVAEMAARIQQEVGGELFSIRVEEPYPADYDACLDRAADEKAENARPKLVEKVSDLSEYDVMFLGYPNWWCSAPMAVFSFLEENDLSGKEGCAVLLPRDRRACVQRERYFCCASRQSDRKQCAGCVP